MKNTTKIISLFASALLCFWACGNSGGGQELSVVTDECENCEDCGGSGQTLGFDESGLEVKSGKVRNGEFFSNLLIHLGLTQNEAYQLTVACDTVFDVRTLRVGNPYKAYYDGNSVLKYLVYEKDRVTSVVFDCTPPYKVWTSRKQETIHRKYADVTIESSLWNDLIAADASPLLVLTLSDIYAWTVDFFGLQKGDRFRVFYDEKQCDGDVIAIDTVRFAVFTHNGTDFPAVMFDQKDGGNVYWNERGESMRKAFLKAPLKYSRVSSGFSYARRHPITRQVRPHTGVDYAAPAGTPVMSIGDGVVTGKKYEGAGGNTVRIRHNSVYSTAYLHLSEYAAGLKVGQRVRQGDVIGYVGSTGRSTGPHLDFRVWKNGSPINPLKMQSPPAEPLKQENKAEFDKVLSGYYLQIKHTEITATLQTLFDIL